MKTCSMWVLVLLCCIASDALSQEPPPLPSGLDPAKNDPSLPPGLDDEYIGTSLSDEGNEKRNGLLPIDIHGFWETRGGLRTTNDSAQPRDATLGETRLQLETGKSWDRASIEFTGDLLFDGVMEEADFDLRRLRISTTLNDSVDLTFGRQIHTWGTGDLLFINDLFPKDWQSFLIGRDVEYLKAPSDTLKVSFFGDTVNLDLVYTPRFNPDRFITGERISFWSPSAGQRIGRDMEVDYEKPDDWFDDDEIALRLHRTFGSMEVALYGYDGFWKSPAGADPATMEAIFPRLAVYGASVRDTVGKGIVHAEVGYYDSKDDGNGGDPLIGNSEFRFLIGYERELAKELAGSIQYYLVRLLDHDNYKDALDPAVNPRDEYRHVTTMRLTKLLMDQNLTLSNFLFYSPSDNDGFWRPQATYNVNDNWEVSTGANMFFGEDDYTFYAQFEDNSNVYVSGRYSF